MFAFRENRLESKVAVDFSRIAVVDAVDDGDHATYFQLLLRQIDPVFGHL